MIIPANRLDLTFQKDKSEYENKALSVLRSGHYVLGEENRAFEKEFADYLGGGNVIGVGCGLDAISIALHCLGVAVGDEVIVQGNTFIATVLAITKNGAVPVFAEPDQNFGMDPDDLEKKISVRTKAVIVTHLYGMMTPMDRILSICEHRKLLLVEDCAQAHGCAWKGKKAGLFGNAGCFSFYPTKNLGAFGDGGAVVAPDVSLAERIGIYRNYGSKEKNFYETTGVNSRLDELQAGLLRVRLSHMAEYTQAKRDIAARYLKEIHNTQIRLPVQLRDAENVWHQFVVCCDKRDALAAFLEQKGISTAIHYPEPPHLSKAYKALGVKRGALPRTEKLADTVLSIPSYYGLTQDEQSYIIDALNAFN